ncbi:hypothetical protein [Paenirhodobacter populi]|uniref:TonB C-terminal domain-containing protein n=1 Tax=Paenirhodobacter populi TaxID=2306993 RepID=A0A443JE06_9RHOB|nr:hypothetical protein [Sinirhodobacter populi]RWR18797.1 hypothetical protein D2T30_15665 [Sinirhodobacter populi]
MCVRWSGKPHNTSRGCGGPGDHQLDDASVCTSDAFVLEVTMLRTIALVVSATISLPALADGVSAEQCRRETRSIKCSVTNNEDKAVGSLTYVVVVGEDGRSIPWARSGGSFSVAGGIEPGEAVDLDFPLPELPDRAAGRDLVFSVSAVPKETATGDWRLHVPRSDRSGPPLTAGEKEAILVDLRRQWNVGSLSTEAMKVSITVQFDMQMNGSPVNSSIRMTAHSGGSGAAAMQAFEAARRAVIRAGADGFPLPAEKYGWWQQLEVVFAPDMMRIK